MDRCLYSIPICISDANANDDIWVAKGYYYPTQEIDGTTNSIRDFAFQLLSDVEIYGGFAGTETSPSQRTDFMFSGTNETVLSGEIGEDNNSDDVYHIFRNEDGVNDVENGHLDGFRIYRGRANGSLDQDKGGGIYINEGSATISNCTIDDNYSTGLGTGVYSNESTLNFNNCYFDDNWTSTGNGGALYMNGGNVTMVNSLFYKNHAAYGGAIYNSTGELELINCTFTRNSATHYAGAIESVGVGAVLTAKNSIFWNNNAGIGTNTQIYNNGTANFSYCDIQESGGSSSWNSTDLGTDGGNNTDSNPLFAGSQNSSHIHSLTGASPCVDIGTNTGVTESNDIRGVGFTRTQNSTTDMGAYEYTSGNDPEEAILYVNDDATSGYNDGTRWNDAYISLQSALDNSSSGTQIWVAKGSYKPSYDYGLGGGSRYNHFRMKDGVKIYGGFVGYESAVSARTDFGVGGANETILDGDINGDDIVTGTSSTLDFENNEENNYHIFYHPEDYGDIANSALLDSFTIKNGYAYSTDTDFYTGGAFYDDNWNSANRSYTLENISFINNYAKYYGGAMQLKRVGALINNCDFLDNKSNDFGGVAKFFESNTSITNCNFKGNASNGNIGGIYIDDCTSSFVMSNCLIVDNAAKGGSGGAFYIVSSSPTLTNITVAHNTATSQGGGVYLHDSNPIITNSIIWGNIDNSEGTTSDNIHIESPSNPNATYSCIGTDAVLSGTGNINVDPQFYDAGNSDFRISQTSPCADAGNDAAISELFDIRGDGYGRKLSKTDGSVGTIDMGAYEYKTGNDPSNSQTIWTGTLSTRWETPGNWSGFSVPTTEHNVTLANVSNSTEIWSSVAADCKNLIIENGQVLSVMEGGSLIPTGTITNNGTFNVEHSMGDGEWHFVSSPVEGATANIFFGDYLQYYDETLAENNYVDIENENMALSACQGFSWRNYSKGDFTFTGDPHHGDLSIATTADNTWGWNLVGNPYPSSIDWNMLDDTYGTVYIWTGTSTEFSTYNDGATTNGGSRYIAPMQGFLITTSAAGNFSVSNSNRTHSGADGYVKSEKTLSQFIKLKMEADQKFDEVFIQLDNSYSNGFEIKDGFKILTSNPENINIYTKTIDGNLSIDRRPECESIQLGVKSETDKNMSISIIESADLQNIQLEDTKHNTFHNLSNGAYEFNWNSTDSEERFILHLKVTGLGDFETSNTQIFAYQKTINIRSIEKLNNAHLNIVDMMGRTVYEQTLVDGQNESITVALEDGVYLVQLVSDSGTQVEKVILK